MELFFKNLPKITNNHVHIFALYPYKKLLNVIKRIDTELYGKIYLFASDKQIGNEEFYQNTLAVFNEQVEGMPCKEKTELEDWINITQVDPSNYIDDYVITKKTPNPFVEFEKIQKKLRIFARHYKVYYYLWYCSLYANYKANVFYLNVRAKPGTINTDVKCNQRLYLDSKHILSVEEFNNKMNLLVRDDRDINPNDFKFMYRQYVKTKFESDLILKAVHDFNTSHLKPHFVSADHLINDDVVVAFNKTYQQSFQPQMMVQYIITFPKPNRQTAIDFKGQLITIKQTLYIAIIINQEYGFKFFNGIDFVGNEQETHELIDIAPILNKLMYFRKYGIFLIPHIGETNIVSNTSTESEKYILDRQLNRIGHGISFVTGSENKTRIGNGTIYIESCPISNYLLGYYHPKNHPHRYELDNPHIRLMICSDDNGVFGYSTVKRDYMFIYKYWNVTLQQFHNLIINGISVIEQPYRQYYLDVLNSKWSELKLDTYPNTVKFDS